MLFHTVSTWTLVAFILVPTVVCVLALWRSHIASVNSTVAADQSAIAARESEIAAQKSEVAAERSQMAAEQSKRNGDSVIKLCEKFDKYLDSKQS